MLVTRLGIFDYNPIISNEELESMHKIDEIEWMPVHPKELVQGSETTVQLLEENNNKFSNLLLMPEDEQQVYLAPSTPSASPDTSRRGSMADSMLKTPPTNVESRLR